jgi:hypothetical protein
MQAVKTFRATAAADLEETGGTVHDAYFDPAEVTFDSEANAVNVPLLQEGGAWAGLPGPALVKENWRYREYDVRLFRCVLTIHAVRSYRVGPEGCDEPGMLDDVIFEHAAGSVIVRTVTGPPIVAEVDDFGRRGGRVRHRGWPCPPPRREAARHPP